MRSSRQLPRLPACQPATQGPLRHHLSRCLSCRPRRRLHQRPGRLQRRWQPRPRRRRRPLRARPPHRCGATCRSQLAHLPCCRLHSAVKASQKRLQMGSMHGLSLHALMHHTPHELLSVQHGSPCISQPAALLMPSAFLWCGRRVRRAASRREPRSRTGTWRGPVRLTSRCWRTRGTGRSRTSTQACGVWARVSMCRCKMTALERKLHIALC